MARLVGLMVAAIPAVEMGKLHYRTLEREKIAALKQAKGNYGGWMQISREMKTEIKWWIDNVAAESRKIIRDNPNMEIYTDASGIGWGGHVNGVSTGGSWRTGEHELHINVLEIKAILFTLMAFGKQVRGKHVKVFCDNQTAVTYVNEMGGTKSIACNEVCVDLWEWCNRNGVWITCSHIPGRLNVEADRASRVINDRNEWKLNKDTFKDICEVLGMPDIDLFASRLNNQLEVFCSFLPDPDATYFDAFTLDWNVFRLLYVFPPFSLVARCLQKIQADEATGIIIVPRWQTQPWWSVLENMTTRTPFVIRRRKGILTHPLTREDHPLMEHTDLMACLVSGRSCKRKA